MLITTTHNCLPFSALSTSDQEKVLEKYSATYMHDDWHTAVYDGFIARTLGSHGVAIDEDSVCFRGFHAQGSGVSFSGRVADIHKLLDTATPTRDCPCPAIYRDTLEFLFAECDLQLYTKPFSSFHAGQNCTVSLGYVHSRPYYKHNRLFCAREDVIEAALPWLRTFWSDTCDMLEVSLYKHIAEKYEHLTAVESIAECFDAHGLVFEIGTGIMYPAHEGHTL